MATQQFDLGAFSPPLEGQRRGDILVRSKGIVSGFRRLKGIDLIQVDAAINSGNSGGPIVDAQGRVLAIASQTIPKDVGEGIGFGICVDEVRTRFSQFLL